ncbi:MAG: SpoIIE family protein phosphatase [bacterium]|nr:SpoIIE family protein phosphatase [bacterium]
MKARKKYIIILLIFFLIPAAFAPLFSKTIIVDNSLHEITLGLHMDVLEDESKKITIDELLDKKYEDRWAVSTRAAPSFGYTHSAYWVRFSLKNKSDSVLNIFIEQVSPHIDDLRFYTAHTVFKTGDNLKFSERYYNYKTFIFPLELEPGSQTDCYLRFETTGAMRIILKAWKEAEFKQHEITEYSLSMLSYGAILIMIFFNLFIYISVRHISYLSYVLMTSSFLSFIVANHGTSFQFLWPNSPQWNSYFILLSIFFMSISVLFFTRTFLETKINAPRLHKASNSIMVVNIIVGFCTVLTWFFPVYSVIIQCVLLTISATAVYFIIVGVYLVFKRQRSAYFFTISISPAFLGGVIYVLQLLGVLSINLIFNWGMLLGLVAFALIISFALADRINSMKKELKTFSDGLEIKVEERTIELVKAMKELEIMNLEISEVRDSLWAEMELARKIQTVLLPKKPHIQGYDISVYMEPALQVGGDYYDIINTGKRDWIIIGDVSGHGIPAGLIMMMAQTAIHMAIKEGNDINPVGLLSKVNRIISENIHKIDENTYMTITALACFQEGSFSFSGLHQDIMIYKANTDSVEEVETDGLWIGLPENIREQTVDAKLSLDIGDTMFLYTDGIVEAWKKGSVKNKRNIRDDMFGPSRLRDAIARLGNKPLDEIKDGVLAELKDYNCHDDVTMVLVRRTAPQPPEGA